MITIEETQDHIDTSNRDSTPELKASAERAETEEARAPIKDPDEKIEPPEPRLMLLQLESWKKIFKTCEALNTLAIQEKVQGAPLKTEQEMAEFLKEHQVRISAAEGIAHTLQVELEQEGKELAELEGRAEHEAAALQKVLEICENRIAANEALIEFLETSNAVERLPELKRRFGNLTRYEAQIDSLVGALMGGVRTDIGFYVALKKTLNMNLESAFLVEYLYAGIYLQMQIENKDTAVLPGRKQEIDKRNPEYEFCHFKEMLTILKRFLSPAYDEFQNVHISQVEILDHREQFSLNLDYAKSCDKILSSFESKLNSESALPKTEKDALKAKAKHLRLTIERITDETQDFIGKAKPDAEDARAASQVVPTSKTSKAVVTKPKKVSDFQAEKKNKLDEKMSKIVRQDGENLGCLLGGMVLRKDFFDLWSVKQSVAELETELALLRDAAQFEAELREKHKQRQAKISDSLSTGAEMEGTSSTRSSSATNSTSEPVVMEEGASIKSSSAADLRGEPKENTSEEGTLPRKSSEDEKIKQERLARRRALQEKVLAHREKIAQRHADQKQQIKARAQMILERAPDPELMPTETALQAFEVDQLIYLADLMSKDHFLTLENLSNKREETLFNPNLTALVGAFKGRTEFLGSSHFEILVPNTRRPWPINPKSGTYDVETIPLVRRVSWLHRNEGGHSRPLLKPRAKSRCEAVMQTGGLTPARFEAAKASVENHRRRGLR